jgi:hypothetical protein
VARNLVGFRINKGVSTPRKTPVAWMKLRPNSCWGPAVSERIASQLDGIRHWEIHHGDYRIAPDVEATWFIDPPYTEAGRHYRHGPAGIDLPASRGMVPNPQRPGHRLRKRGRLLAAVRAAHGRQISTQNKTVNRNDMDHPTARSHSWTPRIFTLISW